MSRAAELAAGAGAGTGFGPGTGVVRVSLVVAAAENGVIGRGGGLPWHLPDDLKHFKSVTLGKAVLMGRRTFESIGRALPGRRNLVMSRTGSRATSPAMSPTESPPSDRRGRETSAPDLAGAARDVEYVGSVEEACERIARGAGDADGEGYSAELCVIGGAQVYALALPYATRIYLTQVHAVVEGDVYFPADLRGGFEAVGGGWREVERTGHAADTRHAYAMSFVTLER